MSTSLAPVPPNPPVDFDQEIRFAVVMYGGSSLAIYINGVAQELLRLVRATAPEFNGAAHARQQRFVMFVGERLFTFTEAAIQPDGEASRKQFWRFLGAYLFSFLVLAFVSLPVLIILRSAEWPWPALGFWLILIGTVLIAAVPLIVTFLYNLAWFKLKSKLDALLRSAQKH